ncbi:MAG: hypothetical protein FJ146_19795, partial [Deltaproteobacteria bacterium]|nr:hypothetical protein [Deltaproteobacteria bacterium]
MVYSKYAKALLSLLFVTKLNSCSQGASLNGGSGGSPGGAGKGNGGQGGEEDGLGGKAGGKGLLDASGALKEKLKDGRIRLTYKGENQVNVNPVDIVFIVDTSGSMGEERQALEKNLNGFLGQIATSVAKIDYHAWIIASPFVPSGTMDSKLVEVVPRRVDSNDALTQLNNFVIGTLNPAPATQLRDNSQKQFIVVTDDDARGTLATNIVQLVSATPKLTGKTSVSGVIGLTRGKVSAQCSIANVGTQYQELAANPATKGTILDLCSDDWSKL